MHFGKYNFKFGKNNAIKKYYLDRIIALKGNIYIELLGSATMYVTREIESDIRKWIHEREIISIIGPRQSGKTTLLYHLMEELIAEDTFDRAHVFYATFDDEIERQRFDENPIDYIEGRLQGNDHHIFLFDEVQYLENAGPRLKQLFDAYHQTVKFIITGSSSLDIRDIASSLVGRAVFFHLHPFSFPEFLRAKSERLYTYHQKHMFNFDTDYQIENLAYLDELGPMLREYMTYGGFPRIVLMNDVEKKEFLLKELVTLYIEKDILKQYGQPFRRDTLRILQYIAFHCGKLVDFAGVSSHLDINIKRINNVISILEDTFIIKLVRPYFKNLSTELRKRPKVFFLDNGIRNVLAEDFKFSEEKGFLFENHVFTQLIRKRGSLKYWRTTAKAEVDFIKDGIPIEVKVTPKVTRALRSFVTTYSPPLSVIVNSKTLRREEINGTILYSIPASLLP